MELVCFRFTAENTGGLLNMEWAGQGGSGPGIMWRSLDNCLGVTEENHENQIYPSGVGAAIWSQLFPNSRRAMLWSQRYLDKPVNACINCMRGTRGRMARGLPGCSPPSNFTDMISNILSDLPFSQNQPQQSADGWYSRILKNEMKITGCLDDVRKTSLDV